MHIPTIWSIVYILVVYFYAFRLTDIIKSWEQKKSCITTSMSVSYPIYTKWEWGWIWIAIDFGLLYLYVVQKILNLEFVKIKWIMKFVIWCFIDNLTKNFFYWIINMFCFMFILHNILLTFSVNIYLEYKLTFVLSISILPVHGLQLNLFS